MAAPTATATASLSGGASTRLGLLGRLLRRLGQETYYDTNTNALASNGTSVTIATGGASRYEVGDIIEWWEDGTFDAAIVSGVADTTLTLQNPRGAFGTTAAAHDGSATPKRFRKVRSSDLLSHTLAEFIDQAVDSLYPDVPLVQVSTYTAASDVWYALPAAAEDVIGAYQLSSATPQTEMNLAYSQPRWFHTGFAATGKAVKLSGIDTSLSNHYILTLARHGATDLTAAQQDIVVLHAARLAMEALSAKAVDRTDPIVQGAENKMQLWRREEDRLRARERRTLDNYLPRLDKLTWRSRGVDLDSSSSVRWVGH